MSYVEGNTGHRDDSFPSPDKWDMRFFVEVLEHLSVRNILRIDPDWLPTATYLIERISPDGETVEDCGKGLTALDAWFSAVFESIERSAAEGYQQNKFLRGSHLKLASKYPLCAPTELFPSKRETESLELEWCMGQDLFTGKTLFVPVDCVCFPYEKRCLPTTTVGLAANVRKDRAILHALCEVIEHDALSIHQYTGLPGRDIVLCPEDEPLYGIAEELSKAGVETSIRLLDNGLHIPTVLAMFDHMPKMPGIRVAGAGCHLDPFVAARRAITECCQSASYWYRRYQNRQMIEGRIYHPPLYLESRYSTDCGPLRIQEIKSMSAGDVASDLEMILNLLQQVTSQVILVDLTREPFAFPCVKILIPNFEDMVTGDSPVPRGRAERAKSAINGYIRVATSQS